jgi:hypothetical protein
VPAAAAAGRQAACSEAQPEKEWFDGMLSSCSKVTSISKAPQMCLILWAKQNTVFLNTVLQ